MALDTTKEAADAQTVAQRRLGPEGRFLTACKMTDCVRGMALARILAIHPEFDESRALRELVQELYGIRRID